MRSPGPSSLSRIPFAPREQRVVDGMSRWMGVLGRFQVLAGGLLLLTVLGVAIAYGTTESLEPAVASDTTPPLVTLGEIDPRILIALGIGAIAFGGIVLRGGVLLTDAAEDFERVVHSESLDQHHLENALRRLRSYYRLELGLTLALLGLVIAWALPGFL